MKTLQELYTEIIGSEELKKAFSEAAKDGKVTDFLMAHGCEATVEEIKVFLKEKSSQPLSEEELDSVAGGGCDKPTYTQGVEIAVSIGMVIICAGFAIASAVEGHNGVQKDNDKNYLCNLD